MEALFSPILIQTVNDLIAAGEKTGERVSAWDEIRQLLTQHQVAWVQQVPPEFCGIAMENRSGSGVGGSEAQHHGLKVRKAGFSWQKASDATAFERAPDDIASVKWNDELVKMSGGLIPPLVALKLLRFACSTMFS